MTRLRPATSRWIKAVGKGGEVYDVSIAPADVAAVVSSGRFLPPIGSVDWRAGFCWLDEPLAVDEADYTEDHLRHGSAWCFGWRVEDRRPPAATLRLRRERAEQAWLAEYPDSEAIPSAVRQGIREEITRAAVQATTPKTTITPITSAGDAGTLVVHGRVTGKAQDALVRALFVAGFVLAVRSPERALSDEVYAQLLRALPGDLRSPHPAATHPDPVTVSGEREVELEPHVHADYLTWLWWRSVIGGGTGSTEGIEWWIQGTIRLESSPGGGEASAPVLLTIGGDGTEDSTAALAALADGYTVRSLGLGLRLTPQDVQNGEGEALPREPRECRVVLEGWAAASIRLPACVQIESPDDVEAGLHERLALHREVCAALDALWRRYCEDRADPTRWGVVHDGMRAWLGLELARRFVFDADTGQGLLFAVPAGQLGGEA